MIFRAGSVGEFEQCIIGIVEQVLEQFIELFFGLLSYRINDRRKRLGPIALDI